MALALGLIIAIILLKYKPTYKVTVKGQEIGYVDSEQNLEDRIQSEIIEMQGKNIDFVSLDNMPSYEFKLVSRSRRCNEDEIMVALKENARIMYKYYAVILNQETVGLVDNLEEAEQAINQIKEEHKEDTVELELSVTENYTENINEISMEAVQVAQAQVEEKVSALIAEEQAKKQAEEQAKKEAEEKAKKEANALKANSNPRVSKSKTVSSEINVIGLTVDEAIPLVDKFLDDCFLAKLETARIVHGKGTGKLRQGIHAFLKKQKRVKSFRIGTYGEGEMGVTIVELKI